MSSKKKTKASKLSRMSEEEKMRYLQHRIAMEEEAQRRKHRLIAAYFKNKAVHEQNFSRLNLAKINQHWRQLLRQIKCKELKNEAEELWNKFEHVLQRKNTTIDGLLSNFDNVEIQYSTQFQKHMEMISELMETHRIRLDDLYGWYIQNLQISIRKVDEEKLAMVTELDKDIETLREQCSDTIKQCQEKLRKISLDCEEDKVVLSEKLMNNIHRLEQNFRSNLTNIRNDYQRLFENYEYHNQSKIRGYLKLLEIDKQDILEIEQQNQLVRNYREAIRKLKIECANLEKDTVTEENALNVSYSHLLKQFQRLSKQLEDEKFSDKEKLKTLSSRSNAVIEELACILKKGSQLQQMAKNCNKMEVTKVISENTYRTNRNMQTDFSINNKDFPFYDKMDNFWEKYNEVILNNEELKTEKQKAEKENAELRRKLKRHLKTIRRPCSVPRKCGF